MSVVQATAPVRIDFAGGWSDVPDFADTEGGRVVNAAISLQVVAECRLGDTKIRLHAEDLDQHAVFPSHTALQYNGVLDLHKAALRMLPVTGGIEVITRSDVPSGSGLGASGALDVALLAALGECREERIDAADLAEWGFLLETSELGLVGGRQDQCAAAYGGFSDLTFGAAGVERSEIVLDAEGVRDLKSHCTVIYTGQSHFSSNTHQQVWSAYHRGDADVVGALRTIRDLADEAVNALHRGNWEGLARVIDTNWQQQQVLHATISTKGIAEIEVAVRAAGAMGVKATGAGAGGCLLVLSHPRQRPEVERAAEALGARVLTWGFAFDGVTVTASTSSTA